MTANNINKFVRGNANLKPWILSKNSADIVNSYVQWLYKQAPHHFKNDLEKPRLATSNLESQFRTHMPPVAAAVRYTLPIVNKSKTNGYVAAPLKKLVKSPNLKIYNTRRFASSASSSTASFFRNNYEERRKRMYKPANGMQVRTYTGSAAMPAGNFYNSPGVAKYIAPTRLYNELSNQLKTNAIAKDLMLMSVDKMMKQKIRVVPVLAKAPRPESVESTKRDTLVTSFKGWLPSVIHMSKFTALPVIKKPPAVKKGALEKCSPPFGSMSAGHANARHQVSPPCTGVSTRSYYLQSSGKSTNSRVKPTKECIPLVCRSRTTRSVRSRSPRPLNKARKY